VFVLRYRALLLSLAYEESGIYGHVDGSVLLSFSCSGFTSLLFFANAPSLSFGVSHL
jgi:hypothetical protein